MRDDNYPAEVSDPERDGLPDTADDDSSAYDEVDSGRWADGPDPAPLPGDRPQAMNRFGTTPEEEREGDTLDHRLAQEEPDVEPDGSFESPSRGDESLDESSAAAAQFNADVYGESPTSDPRSQVSMYDMDLDGTSGAPVGRLVAEDEGFGADTDPDSVAYDAGAAGGGPSAEELAIHETEPPTYR